MTKAKIKKKKTAADIAITIPEGGTCPLGVSKARRVHNAGEMVSSAEVFDEIRRQGDAVRELTQRLDKARSEISWLKNTEGKVKVPPGGLDLGLGSKLRFYTCGELIELSVVFGGLTRMQKENEQLRDDLTQLTMEKTTARVAHEVAQKQADKFEAQVEVLKEVLVKCATGWGE